AEVSELERAPLGLWKVLEAFADLGSLEVQRYGFPGVGQVGGPLGAIELRFQASFARPSQPVDGAVVDDREQPVSDTAARGVEGPWVSPEVEEGILHRLLGRI